MKPTAAQLRAGKRFKKAYLAYLLKLSPFRALALMMVEALGEPVTKPIENEHKENN